MDPALISGSESSDISERESIFNFFDHLVFYLMDSEDFLPQSVLQNSQLTDSIARVIDIFVRQLMGTRCFEEAQGLFNQSEERVSGYIARLSGYLVPFVPRHCLIYFAIVCMIYICYPENTEVNLEEAIRGRAVECLMMFIYWRRDQICMKLDLAAKQILEEGNFDLGSEFA